ncbi:MAG: DUF134 domain-containing protein [Promethearchaeota archaeon]
MPKKLLRVIDPESFQKSKITYRNSQRKSVDTEPILLNLEEYEALRLYYYTKLPQSECAVKISVSQPTFSRILRSGLEKLVQALVEDKDFEIIGGHVSYEDWFGWACWDCDNEWQTENILKFCPKCQSTAVYKLKKMVTHFS